MITKDKIIKKLEDSNSLYKIICISKEEEFINAFKKFYRMHSRLVNMRSIGRFSLAEREINKSIRNSTDDFLKTCKIEHI